MRRVHRSSHSVGRQGSAHGQNTSGSGYPRPSSSRQRTPVSRSTRSRPESNRASPSRTRRPSMTCDLESATACWLSSPCTSSSQRVSGRGSPLRCTRGGTAMAPYSSSCSRSSPSASCQTVVAARSSRPTTARTLLEKPLRRGCSPVGSPSVVVGTASPSNSSSVDPIVRDGPTTGGAFATQSRSTRRRAKAGRRLEQNGLTSGALNERAADASPRRAIVVAVADLASEVDGREQRVCRQGRDDRYARPSDNRVIDIAAVPRSGPRPRHT